MKIKVNI